MCACSLLQVDVEVTEVGRSDTRGHSIRLHPFKMGACYYTVKLMMSVRHSFLVPLAVPRVRCGMHGNIYMYILNQELSKNGELSGKKGMDSRELNRIRKC